MSQTVTQASEKVLVVEDLTVSFDGFKAVDSLSLSVDRNELRVIIGPNGAGKTTLLDMICGKTNSTNPGTGQLYIVDSFIVVVFGGVQSLAGTALSAFAIAQTQTWLEFLMSGSMAKATILLLVIVVLYFRPNGLFALRTRS